MAAKKDKKPNPKKGLMKDKLKEMISIYLAEPFVPFAIFIFISVSINAFIPLAVLPSFISLYGSLASLAAAAFVFYWTLKTMKSNEAEWEGLKVESQILIVFGPYHYSRNPMFVACILVYIALFIFLNNIWGFVFLIPLAKMLGKHVIAPREEAFLQEYGDIYADYHSKTPRWM